MACAGSRTPKAGGARGSPHPEPAAHVARTPRRPTASPTSAPSSGAARTPLADDRARRRSAPPGGGRRGRGSRGRRRSPSRRRCSRKRRSSRNSFVRRASDSSSSRTSGDRSVPAGGCWTSSWKVASSPSSVPVTSAPASLDSASRSVFTRTRPSGPFRAASSERKSWRAWVSGTPRLAALPRARRVRPRAPSARSMSAPRSSSRSC